MTPSPSQLPVATSLLPESALARRAAALVLVVAGTALLVLSAKVRVPLGPVDMSLQTLAVMLIGGLYGGRLAVVTVLAYLAEGALGLPVFQGTPDRGIGLAYMVGPTGGYLAGFVVMAAITGFAVDRGWASHPMKLFSALLVAEFAMLSLGASWLSALLGPAVALKAGFGIFVLPDLLKVAVAGSFLIAMERLRKPL